MWNDLEAVHQRMEVVFAFVQVFARASCCWAGAQSLVQDLPTQDQISWLALGRLKLNIFMIARVKYENFLVSYMILNPASKYALPLCLH